MHGPFYSRLGEMKSRWLISMALLASLSTAFAQQNTPAQAAYVAPVVGSAAVSSTNPLPVANSSQTGISQSGFVGTTSAQVVAAGAFSSWVTIQNTHASQILYLSFAVTATTTNGIALNPGAFLTLPFGPKNALNGIGSGASTTFSVVGY